MTLRIGDRIGTGRVHAAQGAPAQPLAELLGVGEVPCLQVLLCVREEKVRFYGCHALRQFMPEGLEDVVWRCLIDVHQDDELRGPVPKILVPRRLDDLLHHIDSKRPVPPRNTDFDIDSRFPEVRDQVRQRPPLGLAGRHDDDALVHGAPKPRVS